MAPEYIAITITISVLGGVVVFALFIVCITKIVSNKSLKKKLAGVYGNTVAHPSYVGYPVPEPYTAAPYDQDDDSWPPGYLNNYDPNEVDILDGSQYPGAPILQDLPRLPSHLPRRTSYVQDNRRRSLGIPRRPSNAQGMPRSRYSYAPEVQRRSSNARRPQTQDPSNGQYKLWFNYLKEDPGYFSPDALDRNKQQSRLWKARRGRNIPPSTPHHAPQHNYHHQAASRLSWM